MDLSSLNKDFIKQRIYPICISLLEDQDIEVKIEGLKNLPLLAYYVKNAVLDYISKGSLY